MRLTTDPAVDTQPKWSPDGRTIAFERALTGGRIAIMLIPPLGGRERRLFDFVSHWYETIPRYRTVAGLSWSPDSKWLAVSGDMGDGRFDRILVVSVETGEARPLIQPPSKELGDYLEEFFPRWKRAPFHPRCQIEPWESVSPLAWPRLLSTRGAAKAANARCVASLGRVGWQRDGRLCSSQLDDRAVYRMPVTGASPPVRIEWLGTGVNSIALSRDGRRLAYSVGARNSTISRLDLSAGDAKTVPERFIASTRRDVFPQYSPDGRRIAFYSNRSGTFEVWVCEADGSKAAAITSMKRGTSGFTPMVARRPYIRVRFECNRHLSGLYGRRRWRKGQADNKRRDTALRRQLVPGRTLDLF